VSRPICQADRKDGQPCRAPALASGQCWAHDPSRAEIAARARAEGAAKGGRLRAIHGRRKRLDTPAAVVAFLSGLVYDVAEGRREAEIAKTLAYALNVQLKALDLARHSDLEQLRDELRDELAELRRRRA
jgi:hypothetical protein